jgi:tRNA-specific 2-thiouridylase
MKSAGEKQKVVVAMSGGVDSSVAAALLLDRGYDVVGCFMRLGSDDSVEAADAACTTPAQADAKHATADRPVKQKHQGCCSLNDAEDARLVASILGVPFYVLNFRKDFGRIMDYFVAEYNAGRTPNPCVRCNDWLKFGKLADYAASIDADYVATGHYARIDRSNGRTRLLCGVDGHKDQSYVLFGMTRPQLERMMLPIGELDKTETRRIAQAKGLPVFNKPDSYEICFVPDNDYRGFIDRRSPRQVAAGNVVDSDDNVLGTHDGHQHFTIGQRRGISVSLGYPIYVIDKDAKTNTVTVGAKKQLLAEGLAANQTNWLIDPPADTTPCTAKIRSNSPAVPATVRVTGSDALEVRFEQRQRAVSPGQVVACYQGDELIGGGWIDQVIRRFDAP